MTSGVLSRLTVLVTRPDPQCDSLCRLIAERGGESVPWPAIEIEGRRPDDSALAELASAAPQDLLIFVSRNAVAHGASLLLGGSRPRLAAIGPSTWRALEQAGAHPDIESGGYDSEALLTHPALQELSGCNVFIARGTGGRELLGRTLRERGATVRYLDVYRRRRRTSVPEARACLLGLWRAGGVSIYTATSVEILDALHADLGVEFQPMLASTPLVTASRRVVQRSDELQHRATRILAAGPDDHSLVEAIAAWRYRPGDPAGHRGSET